MSAAAGKRVAVVTGSNKGIGFAIVKALCEKFDGDVYLTPRNEGRGRAAIEKLSLQPQLHQLDIDDEASALRFRDYLKSKYGGIDVWFRDIMFLVRRPHATIVNVSSSVGHLIKISVKDDIAVELRKKLASLDLTIEELKKMIQDILKAAQTGDHLKLGWPNSAYATSKIGISALTRTQQKAFDQDSRQDIIVNSVHPGYEQGTLLVDLVCVSSTECGGAKERLCLV